MSVVCPVCQGTMADDGANYCTNCGHPFDDQQFEAATIPEIDRGTVLSVPALAPSHSDPSAPFFNQPTTLPPWFGEDSRTVETLPGIDAGAVTDGGPPTVLDAGAPLRPDQPTSSLHLAPGSAINSDQPTRRVDRYQGPIPSFLRGSAPAANELSPRTEMDLRSRAPTRPEDPWAVDETKTVAQRPTAMAAQADDVEPALPVAPSIETTSPEAASAIFAPLAGASPAASPSPLADAVAKARTDSDVAENALAADLQSGAATPFAIAELPLSALHPVVDDTAQEPPPALPPYSPRPVVRTPRRPAPPAVAAEWAEPSLAVGQIAAPVEATCWQCGTPIERNQPYFLIAGRPWCATCGAPYAPSILKDIGRILLTVGRLAAFFGCIVATYLLLPAFRVLAAAAVGFILFWVLFFRREQRIDAKRVEPGRPLQ